MQSLLIVEDFHHGQFVQQGLKYESIPTRLLSFQASPDEIMTEMQSSDSIFLLVHRLELLDEFLQKMDFFYRRLPIIVLAQTLDPRLLEYVRTQKIKIFFTRPFPFRVLAHEVRMLVYHQNEPSIPQILRIRDLELNQDTHEVLWKGQSIKLRHKEFILLEYLMLNAGKLLSREMILESVWDRNADIFTNTVDVHINKLRKKIDYNISEKFIHTIHCSGYIFS